MGDTDVEEEKMRMYRSIIARQNFPRHLQQFNLYHLDSKHQPQLQVVQERGTLVIFGMLKIYWGTQKVIRLKKEELSWKRRSTRIAYENGIDEKLMSEMGSGAKSRRSLKLQDSFEATADAAKDAAKKDPDENGTSDSTNGHEGENGDSNEDERKQDDKLIMGSSSTMPHKGRGNLNRRTMSFSGHMYKSNTAVFRPKYGTVSNVRVSSKHTTPEVIELLLRKFAVENSPSEFNLYEVMQHGESHELKHMDFPLLKRVIMGPDEHVNKIFIMEKKTQEISPEIAQYINLQMPVLNAIIQKFNEEEERELMKIKQRYAQYKANLQKKMANISTDVHSPQSKQPRVVQQTNVKPQGVHPHGVQPQQGVKIWHPPAYISPSRNSPTRRARTHDERPFSLPPPDVHPEGAKTWRIRPRDTQLIGMDMHPDGAKTWRAMQRDVQPRDVHPEGAKTSRDAQLLGMQLQDVHQEGAQIRRARSRDAQPQNIQFQKVNVQSQTVNVQSQDVQPQGVQYSRSKSLDEQPQKVQPEDVQPHSAHMWHAQSRVVHPQDVQMQHAKAWRTQSLDVQSQPVPSLDVQPWDVHYWHSKSLDEEPRNVQPNGKQTWRAQAQVVHPQDVHPQGAKMWRGQSPDVQPHDVQPWGDEQTNDVPPRSTQTWGAKTWEVPPWGIQPHSLQSQDVQSPSVQSPDSNKKKKGFFGWRK